MTVSRIEFSPRSLAQLDQMAELYALPSDTRNRVAGRVMQLADFPDSGAPLTGVWDGYRFVLGPWSWMLIIYEHLDDLVAIATIEDSRTAAAATTDR